MKVLAEISVQRYKVHVEFDFLQDSQFGVAVNVGLDDSLQKILEIPESGRVDFLVLHGHEQTASSPVLELELSLQEQLHSFLSQRV